MDNTIYYVCKYTPKEIFSGFDQPTERLDPAPANFECAESCTHPNLCGYGKALIEEVMKRDIVFGLSFGKGIAAAANRTFGFDRGKFQSGQSITCMEERYQGSRAADNNRASCPADRGTWRHITERDD